MIKVLYTAFGYDKNGISESITSYKLTQAIKNLGYRLEVVTKDLSKDDYVKHISCTSMLSNSKYYRSLKLDYFEFIIRSYFYARKNIASYDIIHHISPISFRYPNPLSNLQKPFIWGPVGGSIEYPPGFEHIEEKASIVEKLRVVDKYRMKYDPMLKFTMEKASTIVVTCSAAKNLVPERYLNKTVVIPEGIEMCQLNDFTENSLGKYIFSSARLVPYKGIELLIMAFSKSKNKSGISLIITGEGPEKNTLQQLINTLDLKSNVKLLGKVRKEENIKLMKNALFCVFPALNEAFGHVNLEAMSLNKAIIVTDWGGPSDIVEEGKTGFKILGCDMSEYVENMREKIDLLLANSQLRSQLENNAYNRVKNYYSWEALSKRYSELYQNILSSS